MKNRCSTCALAHYHDDLPVKISKKMEKHKNAILTATCTVCTKGSFWLRRIKRWREKSSTSLGKTSKQSIAFTRSARAGVSKRGFSLTHIASTSLMGTARSGALGGKRHGMKGAVSSMNMQRGLVDEVNRITGAVHVRAGSTRLTREGTLSLSRCSVLKCGILKTCGGVKVISLPPEV